MLWWKLSVFVVQPNNDSLQKTNFDSPGPPYSKLKELILMTCRGVAYHLETKLTILMYQLAGDIVQVAPPLLPENP